MCSTPQLPYLALLTPHAASQWVWNGILLLQVRALQFREVERYAVDKASLRQGQGLTLGSSDSEPSFFSPVVFSALRHDSVNED